MSYVRLAIGALVCIAIGVVIGQASKPAEVREVVRTVRVKDTTVDKRRTVTTEKRPDGTVITREETDTKKEIREQDRAVTERVAIDKAQWSVGAYTDGTLIAATIDRRITGDLFVGAYGRYSPRDASLEAGVGVRIEF